MKKQIGGGERPLRTGGLKNGYNDVMVMRAFNKHPFRRIRGYIVRPQFQGLGFNPTKFVNIHSQNL